MCISQNFPFDPSEYIISSRSPGPQLGCDEISSVRLATGDTESEHLSLRLPANYEFLFILPHQVNVNITSNRTKVI